MKLFKKMGFVVKFNYAMTQVGINPNSLPMILRNALQDLGMMYNLSPKEAVAVAVNVMRFNGNLTIRDAMHADDVVNQWDIDGLIDSEKVRIVSNGFINGLMEMYAEGNS